MDTPDAPTGAAQQPFAGFTGNSVFPSQAAMRQVTIVRDQHGRPWEAIVDSHPKARLTWCTAPIPKGWSAPLDVPQCHVVPVPGEYGRCRINYEAWERECADAHHDYDAERRALINKRFPGQGLAMALENTPGDLLAMLGRRPASLHFVRAAKAGNPWVLGLRKADGSYYDVPKWAQPILHELAAPAVDRATQDAEDAAFYAQDEDEVESAADLEDAYDPDALGGQRIAVKRGARRVAA